MKKSRYLLILVTILIPFYLFACKGKGTVEDTLKERLNDQIRITNEIFHEKKRETGRETKIILVDPIKVSLSDDGKKAVTDTSIELHYVTENVKTRAPMRVSWELKDGKWSVVNAFPPDLEFIIAFTEKDIGRLKK